MTASETLYKAIHGTGSALSTAACATGKALGAAFNFASGNKKLHDRGLNRGWSKQKVKPGARLSLVLGELGGSQAGIWTGVALFPVIGPAAIPVAIAVGVVAGMIPARAHAEYLIGKHENQKKNAPKI